MNSLNSFLHSLKTNPRYQQMRTSEHGKLQRLKTSGNRVVTSLKHADDVARAELLNIAIADLQQVTEYVSESLQKKKDGDAATTTLDSYSSDEEV